LREDGTVLDVKFWIAPTYPLRSELNEMRGKLAGQLGADSFRVSFDRRAKAARVESQVTITYFVGFLDDLEAFFPMAEVIHFRREEKKR